MKGGLTVAMNEALTHFVFCIYDLERLRLALY